MIDEIDGPLRILGGGAVVVFDTGGLAAELTALVAADRLCLDDNGARLTPSETDARGREAGVAASFPLVPLGETTEARGTVSLVVVGLAVVDADRDCFTGAGAEDLGGTTDALRLGTVPPVVADFEDDIKGLVAGGGPALVDFRREAADGAEGLVTGAEDTGGLVAGGFPEPNVPELII